MARIRSIKPELPQDAKLARLSRATRYHFVLLWLVSDDEGYFRASPRLLLGQLYPHDRDLGEAAVDRMNAELAEGGFIDVQVTTDGPVGRIRNWSKHQRIDRPTKSHLAPQFAGGSRVPREEVATGVLSLESRSPDLTALHTRAGEDAEPGDPEDQVRGQLPATSHDVYDGCLRSARLPVAVQRTIGALMDGTHASYTPEIVGRALVEMAANGVAFNARYLERSCQALTAPPAPPRSAKVAPPADDYVPPYEQARRLAAELRAQEAAAPC